MIGRASRSETTLASRSFAPWVRSLIDQDYSFHLFYLWLPTVDAAIARVRERVAAGGHAVPEPTIERRYYRGIQNFFALYSPVAHNWRVYDNLENGAPALIASGGAGKKDRNYDADYWRRFSSLANRR